MPEHNTDNEFRTVYVVRLPHGARWTPDYGVAFQHATGMTPEQARHSADSPETTDDYDGEDRITAIGASPREVECVYCDEEMSESRIGEHHADEHPMERYDPAYYSGGAV